MMRRIIECSHGHPLKNQKIFSPNEYSCVACSQGKLIVRPSFTKVISESPVFLERIHGDICGSIHPPCGPFRYFIILIDASTRWSHVCLLSTLYVPIAPTQCTKMGPQRRLGIYVDFNSPSIIRYLEPLTGDVFTARFADCHFNENVFSLLGGEKSIPK
uniref:Uncharacterized protein n=1 Tax=Vitis vinifera TaxID=29760 RepID=A5C1S0_VITVI|nr:hypothetical protein VITISV_033034 [Vitis vinifera]